MRKTTADLTPADITALCERDGAGCLAWTRATDRGYGRIWIDGRAARVHRVMWELMTGEAVPDGMEIDHLCRNRACCDILHLEVVTHRVNMQRAYEYRKAAGMPVGGQMNRRALGVNASAA